MIDFVVKEFKLYEMVRLVAAVWSKLTAFILFSLKRKQLTEERDDKCLLTESSMCTLLYIKYYHMK